MRNDNGVRGMVPWQRVCFTRVDGRCVGSRRNVFYFDLYETRLAKGAPVSCNNETERLTSRKAAYSFTRHFLSDNQESTSVSFLECVSQITGKNTSVSSKRKKKGTTLRQ